MENTEEVTEENKELQEDVKPVTIDEKVNVVNKEIIVAKLDNINDSAELYNLAKVLCDSKLLPAAYSTPEKALLCIAQGRELGLGAVTSLYNMYFIQNKPVLSVHAINALVTSKGVAFKTIKDCQKVEYVEGKFDKITTIRFYRKHPSLGMVIEEDTTVSLRDMEKAGLTEKDNWKKYPKQMLWNRCFVFGARRIASDILLGVMETSEAGDTFNKKYKLDEEGNPTFTDFEEIKN